MRVFLWINTKFLEFQILKPLVWFCYIDDIFFIWTYSEKKVKKFMEHFSTFIHDIKFTYQFDKERISFLDLKVISSHGKLMTSLYRKPTDCRQYLHYKSSHLEHTKRSIIYCQTLRVKRVYSQENDFKEHSSKLKSWFLKRVYQEKIIDTEMKKVLGEKKKKVNNKTEKRIPFVITFHLRLKILQKIIDENFYLLNMIEEVKKVFTLKPMILYRSSRKISSYWVRAKLYPTNRTVGCYICSSKREVCKYVTETDTFTITVTGETFLR